VKPQRTKEVVKKVSRVSKSHNHDLQSDLSDIDQVDLPLSSEGLDLLCESGPREKPKAKVSPGASDEIEG